MKVSSGIGTDDEATTKQRKRLVSEITKFVREPGIVESLTLAHDEGLKMLVIVNFVLLSFPFHIPSLMLVKYNPHEFNIIQ